MSLPSPSFSSVTVLQPQYLQQHQQLTLLRWLLFYPNDVQCICRFPAGQTHAHTHIGHLLSVGFTSQPITSVILDVIPPNPPWQACAISIPIVGWKSGQFRIFISGFTFSQLPPFSPSVGVSRTAVPAPPHTCAEHPEPLSPPSTKQDSRSAASWEELTENTFYSQEVSPSCISWNAAEENPVGLFLYLRFVWAVVLMTRSRCGLV